MSATLISQTIAYLTSSDLSAFNVLFAGSALLIAGCLMVGFLIPFVAITIGLATIVAALLGYRLPTQYSIDITPALIEVIVLSAVILFLGPGAFSFDARMFGRREIKIQAVSHPMENRLKSAFSSQRELVHSLDASLDPVHSGCQ